MEEPPKIGKSLSLRKGTDKEEKNYFKRHTKG